MTNTQPNLPKNTNGLEEHINSLIKDSRTLSYDIESRNAQRFDVIEILADIPERPEPDLFISMVTRWVDVSKLYHKPLRVYAYVNNLKSEKYLQRLTASREDISVTIIPYYLRRRNAK